MIRVNNKETYYDKEVRLDVLLEAIKDEPYHMLIMKNDYFVVLNGKFVDEANYQKIVITNDDDVKLIPSIIGG